MKTDDQPGKTPCTWRPVDECAGCGLDGRLLCRWDRGVLVSLQAPAFSFMALSALTLVFRGLSGGGWWPLIAYAAFCLLFFGFFEIRILCSHCPYYAERSRVLHCLLNHGAIKFFRYRPSPMRTWEKAALLACFAVFAFYPLVFAGLLIVRAAVGAAVLGLWGAITAATSVTLSLVCFYITLRVHACRCCVNLSCPLNRVPPEVRAAFLERNPELRAVWEADEENRKEDR